MPLVRRRALRDLDLHPLRPNSLPEARLPDRGRRAGLASPVPPPPATCPGRWYLWLIVRRPSPAHTSDSMDVSTPTPGPADHGGFAAGEDAPGPLVAALVRGAPKAIRAPLASSLTRAASARAGKLVTCMLVGGWLALFFAGLLGGLDVAVAGSVAAQCLL